MFLKIKSVYQICFMGSVGFGWLLVWLLFPFAFISIGFMILLVSVILRRLSRNS